jgi:hypothetical protein
LEVEWELNNLESNTYLSSSQGVGLTVNILGTSNKGNGIVKRTFSGTVIHAVNLSNHVSDGCFKAIMQYIFFIIYI